MISSKTLQNLPLPKLSMHFSISRRSFGKINSGSDWLNCGKSIDCLTPTSLLLMFFITVIKLIQVWAVITSSPLKNFIIESDDHLPK